MTRRERPGRSVAMASWTAVVVLLVAASGVIGTPLINDLQPGKEWPLKNSVRQPSESDEITTILNDPVVPEITPTISSESISSEPVNEKEPESAKSPSVEPKNQDIEKEKQPVPLAAEVPHAESNIEIVAEEKQSVEPVNVPEDSNIEDSAIEEEPAVIVPKIGKDKTDVSKVDYSGAQVWKVSTNRTGVRAVLTRLRRRNLLSTWGGDHSSADVVIKPDAIKNVTRVFKRENIAFEVIIEDLQKRIDEENPPLSPEEELLTDRSGHRMTWKQYHRVEDIYGYLDYLAKTYPSIVSVKTIGKSHENRDIKVLRISDGKPTNKAIFIDGGIHAREWISPATVTYFINQFAENFEVESEDVKNTDWYFLPVVNPDGYEYTQLVDRLWRKNRKPGQNTARVCFGTDLNRNFGYRWGGKGASSNPCSETYRGASAFSEPESKALSDFITNSGAKFSAYLTYHSYGQYLLYPWGYDNVVPPDYKEMDAVGKQMAEAVQSTGGSRYSVGSSSGLLYPASGGSDDWAKAQGIKYSYTVELSDTGRYGFILPASYIMPVAKENLAGLRVLVKQIHQEGRFKKGLLTKN